jgi:RNA polymerase sigma-70 factor (ECF subfamily)
MTFDQEVSATRPTQTQPAALSEEESLILRSQAGELDAFNQLVQKYQSQVYNLARRMLGDPEMAADASQEAFLNAYEHIDRFRGSTLKTWLLRITANACYDLLRVRQRRPTASLDDLMADPDDPKDFPDRDETPEDAALRRELGGLLARSLDSLPSEQKLVVVLSDVQGMSYEEIAEVTNSNLGTVKSRLSRARSKLRDWLSDRRELLPREFRS